MTATGAGSLEVAGLYKSFGPQAVLEGVELTVPDRSFTAILGPSGSGKTTLLRCLVGFERPDAGRVVLGGRVVDGDGRHVPSEQRKIGYVPQEGGLFPHLTVAGNIGFGLPRSARQAAVEELVDLVGLRDLVRRYPHQLSGGQQQRVALARALAIKPDLVLLDEPFSSLDASLRAAVRDDVRRVLSEAGTTALLVTHDQDEALSLADQVAVLRAGRIVQEGSPAQIYAQPVDAELARFLGEGNLVQGRVSGGRVQSCFGELTLLPAAAAALHDGESTLVLIRPEQVVVEAGSRGAGVAGRVVHSEFHGHDTVITVSPGDRPAANQQVAGSLFQARLADGTLWDTGAEVTLSARGMVMAWPAAQ